MHKLTAKTKKMIAMHKLKIMALIVSLSFVLTTCYDSSSEKPAPHPVALPPVGHAANGSTYYQTNCGACHKAGQDDPTSAFGASNLAQRHDMMTTDMSNFDTTSTYTLMGAYSNIPAQRVADLKAYLKSVPKI